MLVDSESWHISFSMCKRIQEDIRIIFVSMMETVQEWFVNEKKFKYIIMRNRKLFVLEIRNTFLWNSKRMINFIIRDMAY